MASQQHWLGSVLLSVTCNYFRPRPPEDSHLIPVYLVQNSLSRLSRTVLEKLNLQVRLPEIVGI